jgi:hypothetical protein
MHACSMAWIWAQTRESLGFATPSVGVLLNFLLTSDNTAGEISVLLQHLMFENCHHIKSVKHWLTETQGSVSSPCSSEMNSVCETEVS